MCGGDELVGPQVLDSIGCRPDSTDEIENARLQKRVGQRRREVMDETEGLSVSCDENFFCGEAGP